MPITIKTADHAPRAWKPRSGPSPTALELLQNSCPADYGRCKEVIQSSFDTPPTVRESLTNAWSSVTRAIGLAPAENHPGQTFASTNGFVRAAFHAYSDHHHLRIRPEDVWFSILIQLSFFINGHAEELRSFFVAHEGQKELNVEFAGSIDFTDVGALAVCMTDLIAKNINDPLLREWIMPDFSTSTKCDTVVAAILMMGAMQSYFSYKVMTMCGIPSVTLLGEREDWVKLVRRLEMLPQLGPEPTQFHDLLKPVLELFIRSFDDPEGPEVFDFWSRIAQRKSMGSGPSYLTGWITAFCFWDADGKKLSHAKAEVLEKIRSKPPDSDCGLRMRMYHLVDIDKIPAGSASVPVVVDDDGIVYNTRMVAGSVGIHVTSSGEVLDIGTAHSNSGRQVRDADGKWVPVVMRPELGDSPGLDTVQPVTGWWMYEESKDSGKETQVPSRAFRGSHPIDARHVAKPVEDGVTPVRVHPLVSPERRLRVRQAVAVA